MDFEIRTARADDAQALSALFGEVFEESGAGLRLFFSCAFQPEYTVLAQSRQGICGMFFALPASLCYADGTSLPAAYLYALGVRESMRGAGIAGSIVRRMQECLPRWGFAAALLKPAQPSLFAYYHRFGFEPAFYCRDWTYHLDASLGMPAGAQVRPVSLDALAQARETFFFQDGCSPVFCWDRRMLRYAGDYSALYGGRQAAITMPDGAQGYAAYSRAGDGLIIQELGGGPKATLLQALLQFEGCSLCRALLPDLAPYAHLPRRAVAAVQWYTHPRGLQRGYFSLALDM